MDTHEDLLAHLSAQGTGGVNFRQSLNLDPKIFQRLVERATGLIAHGKPSEGEAVLVDLMRVDSTNPMLPFQLGVSRFSRGAMEAAVMAYSEAQERAAQAGLTSIESRIRMCRAQALLALDQNEAAHADLAFVEQSGVEGISELARTLIEPRAMENQEVTS